jgi:hypothetical protein
MRSEAGRATGLILVCLTVGAACSQSSLPGSATSGGDAAADGSSTAGDAPAANALDTGARDAPAPDAAVDIARDLPIVDTAVDVMPPQDECKLDRDCPTRPDGGAPDWSIRCTLAYDHRVCRAIEICPAPSPNTLPGCCFIDEDCVQRAHGRCVPGGHCWGGGPQPPHEGHCDYDTCATDADCTQRPHGLCGSGLPRSCQYGPCTTDADCNARAGGQCVRELRETCGAPAVFCRYADDPCRVPSDCKSDKVDADHPYWECQPRPDLQGTMCKDVGPPRA